MTMPQDRRTFPPLRGAHTLLSVASLLIALLLTAVSVVGLLPSAGLYATEDLRRAFLANDVSNLVIGLPILLGSLCLTRQGRLLGVLFWPGALLFVLYNEIVYLLALPFSTVWAGHLLLTALCVYSLCALVPALDAAAIQDELDGAMPARFTGGVLAVFGLLFALRVVALVAAALTDVTPVTETELALHVADFMLAPAWIIGGVLLWQRRAFGYAIGLGLLFQTSMLFVGLMLVMLLGPVLTDAPLDLKGFLVICVMALPFWIPLGLTLRRLAARKGVSEEQ